jgi:hypothetical protein
LAVVNERKNRKQSVDEKDKPSSAYLDKKSLINFDSQKSKAIDDSSAIPINSLTSGMIRKALMEYPNYSSKQAN